MKIGNKYIGIINGKEWDESQLYMCKFDKTNLGWWLQFWRVGIYYDNWNKVDKNIKIKRQNYRFIGKENVNDKCRLY